MSFIWLPAAREIVWLAGHLVRLGTFLAGWFLKLPCARTRIFTPSIFEVAIAYAFIMLWLMRPLKGEELMRAAVKSDTNDAAMDSPRRQWRKVTTAILTALLAADAGFWIHDRYFERNLRATFLSVGRAIAPWSVSPVHA